MNVLSLRKKQSASEIVREAREILAQSKDKRKRMYYYGEQDILFEPVVDPTKANHKIVLNFTKQTVDFHTSNITSNFPNGTDEDIESISDFLKTGAAYRYFYSSDSEVVSCILLSENVCKVELMDKLYGYVVREYGYSDNLEHYSLIKTDGSIISMKTNDGTIFNGGENINVGILPIAELSIDNRYQGVYSTELGIQDAINIYASGSVNEYEDFVDSYLTFSGAENTDFADIQAMKENRVILLPTNADAKWLTKNKLSEQTSNITTQEYFESKFKELTYTPDFTAGELERNTSGVAIEEKQIPAELLKDRILKAYDLFKQQINDIMEVL